MARIMGFHGLQFFIHVHVPFLNIIAVSMARIMGFHGLQFFIHIHVPFSNIIVLAMALCLYLSAKIFTCSMLLRVDP
jgi:ABC-type Fe3+ transport system permease subunit